MIQRSELNRMVADFSKLKMSLPDLDKIAPRDATYVKTNFITEEQLQVLLRAANQRMSEVNLAKSTENKQYTAVANMIKNDPAAPKNLNVDNMTEMIMNASAETGVDPIIIASIAKQETHYTQNVGTGNGSGIMQLTTISIKDMYLRPNIYDAKMKQLIKKYGSWQKVAAAKKKDPSLDLGNFGNLLYKYGSVENLRAAMRKDPQLNLKLGAYLFKAKLNAAGGDVHRALVNYNGSSHKMAYAKSVMGIIQDGRSSSSKFEGIVA